MAVKKRLWEIDFLRGIAVVLMILFNYAFTLRFFGAYSIEGGWLFWWLFPRIIAGAFIFLMGLSLTLSYSRGWKFGKYLRRGAKIFGYGLLISLITWLYLGQGFVRFGILHFIGLSTILAYPFLRYGRLNFLLGALAILAGFLLSQYTLNSSWLLWIGLVPESFYTIDYFPLLPWFGLTLIGTGAGTVFYPRGKRGFRILELSKFRFMRAFSFLGRHSLLIYLAHQPVLLAALYLGIL